MHEEITKYINTIQHEDSLAFMKRLPDGCIDAVITDPPYGTTACKWDTIIPFEPMWEQLKRITKKNGAIVLFSSQPFTSALVMSNPKMYRHQWIWHKNNSAGFVTAKIRPFAVCEDIIVFGQKKVNYYPQMETRGKPRLKSGYSSSENYNLIPSKSKSKSNTYFPKNLINISNASQINKVHPTQKPVTLMEYLVKTYTNEGELVLDFTSGSGSTLVACKQLNRNYVGVEISKEYCDIAQARIDNSTQTLF